MGTTIRRQPVTFDIPNSPDYKFLNITNFRGLDVSSNPFELASNTASDCLNVYVDETNTLTTRPRLDKKMDAPLKGVQIATYNLHDGYMFHYVNTVVTEEHPEGIDEYTMWLFKDGALLETAVSGTIPQNKCAYFEEGDKIYLLDGSRYMVIENNVLTDVVGYVPTVAAVNAAGEREKIEPINLLSNKYKEEYDWDGFSMESLPKSVMSAENTYFTEKHKLPGDLIHLFSDNSAIIWGDDLMFRYVPDILADDITAYDITNYRDFAGAFEFYKIAYGATDDGVDKVFCVLDIHTKSYYKYFRYSDTNWQMNVYNLPSDFPEDAQSFSREIEVGMLGNTFVLSTPYKPYEHYESEFSELVYVYDSANQRFSLVQDFYDSYGGNLTQNNEYVAMLNDTTLTLLKIQVTTDSPAVINKTTTTIANDYTTDDDWSCGISDDGSLIWVCGRRWVDFYQKSSDGFNAATRVRRNFPSDAFIQRFGVDAKNGTAWGSDPFISCIYYSDALLANDFKPTYVTDYPKQYVAGKHLVTNGDVVKVWNPDGKIVDNRTILDDPDWTSKRERLLKSTLTTRFDNNYWFVENNRYYRSQNNDPTYFPITEYNDLGDSNDPISGFNIANDTTLLAYKAHGVFLIQPFESALSTREYSITESKNTVGNTAVRAPIVTTLTEIPLQINNDGVYGLSQLSNVSATERVADLLSEPINERWLKLDDTLVAQTMTLNRLYWTYIIIPDADNQKSLVYLLDNRTNSWYYWELPIVVSEAFVKDNVTEFVDKEGVIYYLTPEDVINKAFLPLLVTEYYDYGRKLIPWHWQSQILPLGTMNYSKRLVNTTFIMTDTDTQDGYGLRYNYKVFRKLASSTPEKEISDELNLVRSTTKKTNISKFGFIQLKLSNITEESQGTDPEKAYRNNKLRLVGLGLKYVLLEGLIR